MNLLRHRFRKYILNSFIPATSLIKMEILYKYQSIFTGLSLFSVTTYRSFHGIFLSLG
jgi:hypothetical protein